MFKILNIKSALLIGFLFIIPIVVLISVAVINFQRVRADLNNITEFSVPALVTLQDMQADILGATEEASVFLLLNDSRNKEKFFDRMDEFQKSAGVFSVAAHINRPGEEESKRLLDEILGRQKELVNAAEQIFAGFENKKEIDTQSVEVFEEKVDRLTWLLDNFLEIKRTELVETKEAAGASMNTALNTITIAGILAFLVAFLSVILIAKSMAKQIEEIRDAAYELARRSGKGS